MSKNKSNLSIVEKTLTPYPLKPIKGRLIADKIFNSLCYLAGIIVLIFLASIAATLITKGAHGWTAQLFTQITPPPGETTGGLKNAIIGSLIMSVLGIALATIIGIASATYLSEFCRNKKLIDSVNSFNDLLLSAPSIIIGLFAYAILVKTLGKFNAIAGIIALAIIALPMIHRTVYDAMGLVSTSLRESAVALGMSRVKVTIAIIFKTARLSIITVILLAFARVLGETAPLLFTSLNNSFMSTDLLKPMSSLPVVIYQYSMSPDPYWKELAWSGALLITITVLVLNLVAKTIARKK